MLVGIEVKSAATVTSADFKGLRALAQAAGSHFHRGIVLYSGTDVVPFGPRLHAVPIEAVGRPIRSRRDRRRVTAPRSARTTDHRSRFARPGIAGMTPTFPPPARRFT
jgi:hypothetical protein